MNFLVILTTFLSFEIYSDDGHLANMVRRNHKLNSGYVQDLRNKSVSIYSQGKVKKAGKKEKLVIYYPQDTGKKHLNPDALQLRVEYKKFNFGNLIPVLTIPVKPNF